MNEVKAAAAQSLGNFETRLRLYKLFLGIGIMRPEEIRKLEGL